jgi:hypothetical protein
VAVAGAGFESYYLFTGAAGANWSSEQVFPFVPSRIVFKSIDYPFLVRLWQTGGIMNPEFLIDAEERYAADLALDKFQVRRYTGTDAKYEIVGMR